MKITRLRPSGVQVPLVTFMNSKGHKIAIQGAIHVGSREYYEHVKSLVEAFDGEVHFEGIKSSGEHELQLKALTLTYSTLANLLGLTQQRDVLTRKYTSSHHEKFKSYDVDASATSSFLVSDDFRSLVESVTKIESKKLLSVKTKRFCRSPLFALFMVIVMSLKKDKEENHDKVILDMRNEFAIEKAINAEEDVFMFWGSKHLIGMEKLLRKAGYEILSTSWTTAIPLIKRDFVGNEKDNEILVSKLQIAEIVSSVEWKKIFPADD